MYYENAVDSAQLKQKTTALHFPEDSSKFKGQGAARKKKELKPIKTLNPIAYTT
jgi:hypothetical protein